MSLPSIDEIAFERSLYEPLRVCKEDRATLRKVRWGDFKVDGWCINCGRESIFRSERRTYTPRFDADPFAPGTISLGIECERDASHRYEFWFRLANDELTKVGQFPSIEDIGGDELRKFRKLLGDQQFGELKRANGLFSHGIGIGSFVYLRRVFERQIWSHYANLEAVNGPIENFETLRMDEKIGALSAVLPPALVSNKAAYSLLSKGIHELDEETCREYFPVVFNAIVIILQQVFEQRAARKAEADIHAAIQGIAAKIRENDS